VKLFTLYYKTKDIVAAEVDENELPEQITRTKALVDMIIEAKRQQGERKIILIVEYK
jgi:hypothetical protein